MFILLSVSLINFKLVTSKSNLVKIEAMPDYPGMYFIPLVGLQLLMNNGKSCVTYH